MLAPTHVLSGYGDLDTPFPRFLFIKSRLVFTRFTMTTNYQECSDLDVSDTIMITIIIRSISSFPMTVGCHSRLK